MKTIQKSIQITFQSNDNSLNDLVMTEIRLKLLKQSHTSSIYIQCHTWNECLKICIITCNKQHKTLINQKLDTLSTVKCDMCVCVYVSHYNCDSTPNWNSIVQEIYVNKVPFFFEWLPLNFLLLFIAVNNHFGHLQQMFMNKQNIIVNMPCSVK